MEANRRVKRNMYVEGNVARSLQVAPEIPERIHQPEKKQISRSARRNREKALSIDFRFVLFLTISIVVTLYICVNYLEVQSRVTANSKEVIALEASYKQMKNNNDSKIKKLKMSVDLENIYKVAVEELDMTYASKGQVIWYEGVEVDYFVQYKDIPAVDKDSIIDYFLNK